jgi:hypothetical protein
MIYMEIREVGSRQNYVCTQIRILKAESKMPIPYGIYFIHPRTEQTASIEFSVEWVFVMIEWIRPGIDQIFGMSNIYGNFWEIRTGTRTCFYKPRAPSFLSQRLSASEEGT